jgi:hypothetical protein
MTMCSVLFVPGLTTTSLLCAVLCLTSHRAGRLWGWTGAGTADGNNCKFVDAAGKAVKQEDILAQIIHLAAAESTQLN